MDPYNVIAGIIFVTGGAYAFLAGTGRVEIKRGDPVKSKQWRERYGRFMIWAGPFLVLFGILQLLGVL